MAVCDAPDPLESSQHLPDPLISGEGARYTFLRNSNPPSVFGLDYWPLRPQHRHRHVYVKNSFTGIAWNRTLEKQIGEMKISWTETEKAQNHVMLRTVIGSNILKIKNKEDEDILQKAKVFCMPACIIPIFFHV